jgi:hypothetical protein
VAAAVGERHGLALSLTVAVASVIAAEREVGVRRSASLFVVRAAIRGALGADSKAVEEQAILSRLRVATYWVQVLRGLADGVSDALAEEIERLLAASETTTSRTGRHPPSEERAHDGDQVTHPATES